MADDVALPLVRRVRVCLLGGDTVVPGVGKADVASALLRGLTADWPGEADPVYELGFNFGLFEREWGRLLEEPKDGSQRGDRWGLGPLGAWSSRIKFDQRDAGKVSPHYDANPTESFASVCPGNPEKLNVGPPLAKQFREILGDAGQDVKDGGALEGAHRKLYWDAEAKPRELVRLDQPCSGLLAAFARSSPEVGDLPGCSVAILDIFEPGRRPLGSDHNVAMLYMAAPNGRVHKELTVGSFLCALQAAATNAARAVREYNLAISGEASSSLMSGRNVRLRGLSAPGLNGQEGVCETWDAVKGRWSVRLQSGGEAGQVKAIRPENLDEHPEWRKTDLRTFVEFLMSERNMTLSKEWKPGGIQVFGEKKFATDLEGWMDLERIRCMHKMFAASVCSEREILDAVKVSKVIETKHEEGTAFIRHIRSLLGGDKLLPKKRPLVDDGGCVKPPVSGPRVVSPPRKRINEVCWDLLNRGFCARGSKCNYIHDEVDIDKAKGTTVAPPRADTGRLFVGAPVQLQGLTKKPHFNGRRGKCENLNESTCRWEVKLGDGTTLSLKEENLKLC